MNPREQVRDFIIKTAILSSSDQQLNDDDSFLEKGIIDSTGILELVSFIEEKFDFEVSDDELIPDNFDSVNQLIKYIKKKSDK